MFEKNPTSKNVNVLRWSTSGMNWLFTGGISPVKLKVQNPGGESFSTFPSVGYTHGEERSTKYVKGKTDLKNNGNPYPCLRDASSRHL